jgi:hypothetical protein
MVSARFIIGTAPGQTGRAAFCAYEAVFLTWHMSAAALRYNDNAAYSTDYMTSAIIRSVRFAFDYLAAEEIAADCAIILRGRGFITGAEIRVQDDV